MFARANPRKTCVCFAILVATFLLFVGLSGALLHGEDSTAANPNPASSPSNELFEQKNLVAWCIVPYDAKKRGPGDRAKMLGELGFSKFAYDYRAEHIPTFDAEIEALKRHDIELTAWWFPNDLNAEAKHILETLSRHGVKTQLWVTGGGGPTQNEQEQRDRATAEAHRIRPIAEAAAKIGCRVGLYNHEGWFGEPENQIAILKELNLPNVGIVYNFHHGHEHLEQLPALLKQMLPHLYAINLNGMNADGARKGQKILQLGQGERDLVVLKTVRDSGYRGPIGILGHTMDDARDRLQDNLDGLNWLVSQLDGQSPAAPKPTPRTPVPAIAGVPALTQPTSVSPAEYCGPGANAGSPLPVEYDAKLVSQIVEGAQANGDIYRGMAVFCSTKFACLSCHKVGNFGGDVGPSLNDVGSRLKPQEIVESFLWPKRQVKPEYMSWGFLLEDGSSERGYKRSETNAEIEVFDPANNKTIRIAKAEIVDEREFGTLMPEGVAAAMTDVQRQDLARFLIELGHTAGLEAEVRPDTLPAEFTYDFAPLDPAEWPHWKAHINQGRLYDFYRKEAFFFRGRGHLPHLLPAFPGLDGGKKGHWGMQEEKTWKDFRWNEADLGTLFAGVFHGFDGVVPKGICIRLGENGELAACFNPQTLRYEALWKGGFLTIDGVRHGFMSGLRPRGEKLETPSQEPVTQPFVYHGFYRSGSRIAFAYRLGDVEMLDAPWVKDGKFERIVAPLAEHPLRDIVQGGTSQWPQEIKAIGQLGPERPYAIDTIPPPTETPWKLPIFFSGHDFLPDGSAMLCSMTGDVWHVTGLDDDLQNIRWRRFASGLHQAQGLVIADGQIYVLGRDQITRLHDRDNDGEADFYECFSNKMQTSPSAHDFICGLELDAQGRFYTASSKQGLLRFSADGANVEVLATGFRNPDGLGLCTDGSVTVPCSEGDWTPASMICLVKPTTTTTPHYGLGGPQNGKPPALPLAYLPRGIDNSSGGQIAITDDRWGPLQGNLVHFSFGQGAHFLLLKDEVAGQAQGAIVPLIGDFQSGVHRGRFNPRDGQLYVSGMAGWGTYTSNDSCFQRVRYTKDAVQLPRSFHVHQNGVLVSFTQPIDSQATADLSKHFAQAWNYRYSGAYGSPELAPCHGNAVGHEALRIAGIHPVDTNTIFVELPDLQPVNQLHLLLQVDQGRAQEMFLTVHKLGQPFTRIPNYQPTKKIIAAHPMDVDVTLLGKTIPNPWRDKLPNARSLEIAAGNNLTYATRTLTAKAGENLKLTFTNPDTVPHNWVLVKPGTLAQIGALTNSLVADPEAFLRQYVPESDDVICYTDIVPGGKRFTIYFQAPKEPGRYPYLCTFPGHWMVMNGELVVE